MAIVATSIPEVQQSVDNADERELWIVGREFERPPYFHAGKGGDTRLARALRVCVEGRITPNSDGSYTVEGSAHRTYRVAETCSCPQSQKAQSKYCYHFVAVCLWIEWHRRLRPLAPPFSPVGREGSKGGRHEERGGGRGDGSGSPPSLPPPYSLTPSLPSPDDDALGNGFPALDETLPLPLPTVTVDERLVQATATAMDAVHRAIETDRMPTEDRMTEDPESYITAQGDAPVAVLDAPVAPRRLTLALPQEEDLERALTIWTTQRQIVQRFLKHQLIAGTDYYQLRLGKVDSKPSLSKAGAEKVLSWLKWSASFTPDTGTWEMLGRPTDLVCYVCQLQTRSGEVVGEGRGARSIKKDNGDINKAIKMAEKSSMVSAVLRTGALSDCFTQDLEDMPEAASAPAPPPPPARPTAQQLRQRIWAMVQVLAPEARTREAVEAYITAHTGMDLHPDFYSAIVTRLEEVR